jgi:hypothetical protein
MLYAQRDEAGTIIALFANPSDQAKEAVSPDDAEVLQFLLQEEGDTAAKHYLRQSDLGLIRVVEDLIELLMQKNLILLTELPEAAQKKILNRKQVRESAQSGNSLLVDDEIPL